MGAKEPFLQCKQFFYAHPPDSWRKYFFECYMILYVLKRELKIRGERGTWMETQCNLCNEAPAKFSTVPAPLQTYFAKVRPVRQSLVLHFLNHGWARRGGTTGSPGLCLAREVGFCTWFSTHLFFARGLFQVVFNMGRFDEIKRPPWDFSSFPFHLLTFF
jgi:hypothetical protein